MKKITVIGLGPGDPGMMTYEAREALEEAELICGYTVYVELVKPLFPEKEYFTTPMRKETDRCVAALEKAAEGRSVAMVCSGDSGVYGMAGLLYELSPEYPGVELRVIPGLTAACSGAAVLGAPLTHDFAVISMSDLLTPWETIEKRLRLAGQADFVVCLYNPMSHSRKDYLKRAADILLESKKPETVCGWVRNIGRPGQEAQLCTLAELGDQALDMFTTVFIGNASTKVIGGKMVTPRGYDKKRK